MADNAADFLADAAVEYQISLMRVEAGMRQATLDGLNELEGDIIATLEKNKGLTPAKKAHLNEVLSTMQKQVGGMYKQIEKASVDALESVATLTTKKTVADLSGALNVSMGPMQLSAAQTQRIATGPVLEGNPMKSWWDSQSDKTTRAIAGEVRKGLLVGEGIDDIQRRIRGTKANGYADGVFAGSKREAEAIVRTAVQATANQAKLDTLLNGSDAIKGIEWVSTLDSRTTPTCRALDGLQWTTPGLEPVDHDKAFPGPIAHWGCFTGDTPVSSPAAVERLYRRTYSGELLTIETDHGRIITCTPNHPLMGISGFIAAEKFQKGDVLLCEKGTGARAASIDPQDSREQTSFAKFAESFSKLRSVLAIEMPVTSPDFHGDGTGNEIGKVWTDGDLLSETDARKLKRLGKREFIRADFDVPSCPRFSHLAKLLSSLFPSRCGFVSRFKRWLFTAVPSGAKIIGARASNAKGNAPPAQSSDRDPKAISDLAGRNLIGDIESDRIRVIRRSKAVSVPVHNLQTATGWYLASGIISHNCRSTQIAVTRSWAELAGKDLPGADGETFQQNFEKRLAEQGFTPDQIAKATANQRASVDGATSAGLDFDAWARKKGDAYLQQILGPGRFKLWKENKLGMRDLTDQKGRELTIAQLQASIEGGTLPQETEGLGVKFSAYTKPVDPPPYAGLASEEPLQFTDVTIEDVSDKSWDDLEDAVKAGLKESDADPINKITFRAALQQEHANHRVIIRDADGKMIAAMAYSDDTGADITLWDVASVQKGGGTKAMRHLFEQAAKQGKGIGATALDDALPFYEKLGFTIKNNGVIEMTPDQAKAAWEKFAPKAPGSAIIDQAPASAAIADFIANPKGQTLKAKWAKKITADFPGLPPTEQLAKIEAHAAVEQDAKSLASKLSTAKKKILEGGVPTPAQQLAIDSLDDDAKASWEASIAEGKKAKSVDLVKKVTDELATIDLYADKAPADALSAEAIAAYQNADAAAKAIVENQLKTASAAWQVNKAAQFKTLFDEQAEQGHTPVTTDAEKAILHQLTPAQIADVEKYQVTVKTKLHAEQAVENVISGTAIPDDGVAELQALKGTGNDDIVQAAMDKLITWETEELAQGDLKQMAKTPGIEGETAKWYLDELDKGTFDGKSWAQLLKEAEISADAVAVTQLDQAVITGDKVTKLKQAAFKSVTGIDPATDPTGAAKYYTTLEPGSAKALDLLQKVETIAAEKQAKASQAAALSGAKKKMLAGAEPTAAQKKAMADLQAEDPAAFSNWEQGVAQAKQAKGMAAPTPGTQAPTKPTPVASPAAIKKEPKRTPVLVTQTIPEPSKLKVEKRLGGSTGAQLAVDANGKKWVIKKGNSAEHVRAEHQADDAYRALGFDVPDGKLFDTPSGPIKVTEYLEGAQTLGQLSPAKRREANEKIKEAIAVDAVLGNWDVIGMGADNVMVMPDGRVFRIDNGGSMEFRAQGEVKQGLEWNDYPTEIFTMRDAGTNSSTADAYAGMDIYQVAAAIERVDWSRLEDLDIPEGTKATLLRRANEAKHTASRARQLQRDNWTVEYAERHLKESIEIRQDGITAPVPKKLKVASHYNITDENGEAFGGLRTQKGSNGVPPKPKVAGDYYADTIEAAFKSINHKAVNNEVITSGSAMQKGQAALDLEKSLKQLSTEKGATAEEKAMAKKYLKDLDWVKEQMKAGGVPKPLPASKFFKQYEPSGTSTAKPATQDTRSVVARWNQRMADKGIDTSPVESWLAQQSGNSWKPAAQAAKYALSLGMADADKTHYWGGNAQNKTSYAKCKAEFNKVAQQLGGVDKATELFTSYHAMVQETLNSFEDVPWIDKRRKAVLLYRTVDNAELQGSGVQNTGTGSTYVPKKGVYTAHRGVTESHSIYDKTFVKGDKLTATAVPFTRIHGLYWLERSAGQGGSSFLGDGEAEFAVNTSGLPTLYDNTYSGPSFSDEKSKDAANWGVPIDHLMEPDDDTEAQ